MNWKGSARKRTWPNRSSVPEFVCRNSGNHETLRPGQPACISNAPGLKDRNHPPPPGGGVGQREPDLRGRMIQLPFSERIEIVLAIVVDIGSFWILRFHIHLIPETKKKDTGVNTEYTQLRQVTTSPHSGGSFPIHHLSDAKPQHRKRPD
jgi:hypothetical protein